VLGDGSWGHGAHSGPGAVVGPGGGSWSYEARGGSRAVGHAGICVCLVFHV
jgi:hypothetical protein